MSIWSLERLSLVHIRTNLVRKRTEKELDKF